MAEWPVILITITSVFVLFQAICLIIVLKKTGKEKSALIKLHAEHLRIIKEQRDLYRELVDELIDQKVISNDNDDIVQWCRLCARQSINTADGTYVRCKECNFD